MRTLGRRPTPSTPPGWPRMSWMSSLKSRMFVSCRGAEYQRSKTLISQSA
jgi:hypothetical protein